MSLKTRLKSGGLFVSAAGKSLLESLWDELIKEWTDPDKDLSVCTPNEIGDDYAYDAGYCVGLAYAIAKIQYPYKPADERIELVLDEARGKILRLHRGSKELEDGD